MKKFIFILSVMLFCNAGFGGIFDSGAMNDLAEELNSGLEEIKEESEWDRKEKQAISDMEYKDKIRQAKIAIQREIEKFIRKESASLAGEDFYRENYLFKTSACEYTLYAMDVRDIGERLFYSCPVKVPNLFGNSKEVEDFRYIGKNSSYDKTLYMLSATEDFRKGVGVNFIYPPNHRQENCLGYSFYFFENPKVDLKKNNYKPIPLEFEALKTWYVDDYVDDPDFVCEEGR